MKIIVVGASGTVGKNIVAALGNEHQLIKASRSSKEHPLDMTSPESIKKFFQQIGKFDALVVAAGDLGFAPLGQLSHDHWEKSFRSKLMGQVNLVTIGKDFINDGGSFTLTSGVLTEVFIQAGIVASSINRAVEGFALATAAEIGRGIRVNVVSPGLLEESAPQMGSFFPGHFPVPGARVGQFYKRAVLGIENGRVLLAV
jgi:NAD(P)-dependent dehydrogenase (short-subunit alcohol dehydrogenase family)